jgi:hypothetical protein
MASWVLVPCLVSLRNEFNELAPVRDKASDGSIGDQAHASSPSDHNPDETGSTPYEDADSANEVHAIDVDRDLRRSGWTMTRAVQIILERHRDGRDGRLQNIIWDGRIWSRSWGWAAREYAGSNPHDKHAHFSARYTTAQERDTRAWGLLEAAGDTGGGGNEAIMSVHDVREYFASAAKGVRGEGSATNIQDRKDVTDLIRFGLGFSYEAQQEPDFHTRMFPARMSQILMGIGGIDVVDESAVVAALGPRLETALAELLAGNGAPLTSAQVSEAVKAALREGTGA